MTEVYLDLDRQKQAKEYARISRRLMLVDLGIGGIYVVAWLVFGWSAALKNLLLTWTQNEWLLVAGYAAVFGLGYLILSLPLSYFEGFVLPHRYGLSNQTLQRLDCRPDSKGWCSAGPWDYLCWK